MTIKIYSYLNFAGNAEEAFNFYKSVFGGEFDSVVRFKDMPMEGTDQLSDDELNKIMHIGLPIGEDNLLMASDVLEPMGQKIKMGNNFYIYVSAPTRQETERLYKGLSVNGSIEMPLTNVPWGAYFGMFEDHFGIKWMVSYDYCPESNSE
jgi:PhnB protein